MAGCDKVFQRSKIERRIALTTPTLIFPSAAALPEISLEIGITLCNILLVNDEDGYLDSTLLGRPQAPDDARL